MTAFDALGGWDKSKNHFLVWPHKEINSVDDPKKVEVTTVDGSTHCSVAKMKGTK